MENKITLNQDGHAVGGYVARFDNQYFDGSEHASEMYVNWLKKFDKLEINIPLTYLHTSQDGRPIGAMTDWHVDDNGLWMDFALSKSKLVEDEILPNIVSGALTHFSTEETAGDDRVILSVALVPIGNAVNARVEEMNKLNKPTEKKKRNVIKELILKG